MSLASQWHAATGAVAVTVSENDTGRTATAIVDDSARAADDELWMERVLQTMFERAPAAICVTRGPSHIVTAANARFHELAAGRAALGRPLSESLPELAEQGIREILDRVIESGKPIVGREVPIRAEPGDEGATGYFNCVYQPLATDRGTEGVLLHAVDVTDLVLARHAVEEKAAELELLTKDLEGANEELDRFAYVASHDLRAPLRGIGNLVHWIEEDLGSVATHETHHHLALLKARVKRLESLIDGILSYSRAGRPSHSRERVDVGGLIEELLDLLDPPDDADIEIVEPMPVLETQRVLLGQVLSNLLSNAIQYGRSDNGLRVQITAARDEASAWLFAVKDEGPGIDPRFHERIWGIFQTLRQGDNAGVGLSLVRKIVEARGGRAWVESREREGARFFFTWPERPLARPRARQEGSP